jgi:hypothetical protein
LTKNNARIARNTHGSAETSAVLALRAGFSLDTNQPRQSNSSGILLRQNNPPHFMREGGSAMKKRLLLPVLGFLLLAMSSTAYAQETKISVLNPRGTPPPIPLIPMAPRLETLDGKTIYVVDVKYEGGASLLRQIMDWFSQNMPKANLVFREKAGSYDEEDSKLWAEIKEKGDAAILAIGH